MVWHMKVRQFHRWVSIVFTVMVVANIGINLAGMGEKPFALWVGGSTLLPLLLLMISGLYMFILPYVKR